MGCTINVVKTKVLISCAVIAQLISAFVFTYHMQKDVAQIIHVSSICMTTTKPKL